MLAIYDEVHLRPGLETIFGQFESYMKMHNDFLVALTDKLRQSWDNSVSPIGDLLMDKVLQYLCPIHTIYLTLIMIFYTLSR